MPQEPFKICKTISSAQCKHLHPTRPICEDATKNVGQEVPCSPCVCMYVDDEVYFESVK